RVARGEDQSGPRTFGMPPASPTFASALPRKPALAWNHARTHRVEALPGGVTVFNLNDHCAVALLWVVPFFGCTLDKIPPRGGLRGRTVGKRYPDRGGRWHTGPGIRQDGVSRFARARGAALLESGSLRARRAHPRGGEPPVPSARAGGLPRGIRRARVLLRPD